MGDFGLAVTFYCSFYCNHWHIFSLISVSLLGAQACGISESHIGKNMTEINITVASVADQISQPPYSISVSAQIAMCAAL